MISPAACSSGGTSYMLNDAVQVTEGIGHNVANVERVTFDGHGILR